MKGIVELKLKDKNGNVVHEEKKHNTVTGFFAEYFRQLGPTKELPYEYTVENAIGGILLFQNSISGTPIRLPHGNKMIGNAVVGVVNGSGTDVSEMGSYVAADCKWVDEDTYQEKFEWTPSQAIGTIGCVCLTSKGWGYIGEGNETSGGKYVNNGTYSPTYMNIGSSHSKAMGTYSDYILCYRSGICYTMSSNFESHFRNGAITINGYYAPFDSVNFKDGVLTKSLLEFTQNYSISNEYTADIVSMNRYSISSPIVDADGNC